MPNPFFQFKQFTIHHDRCAMKVGTDGVLLGAWTSVANVRNILDVGAGTGLISLMLAQRQPQSLILGIDIDPSAVSQAKENVEDSPFADRVTIEQASVQHFAENRSEVFDLIVSNPPFFANSLPSPKQARTLARHTETLSIASLFQSATRLLSSDGTLSLIYPFESLAEILDCADKCSLFVKRQTTVFSTPTARPKRVLLELSKQAAIAPIYNELVIEVERHRYTDAYQELMAEFYL